MYQEFFKPRHARMWRRAKELANVKVMLHCCGGIRPLIPDLIEAGLDAVESRADHLRRHGRGRVEARFRRPLHVLGRRLRHPFHPLPRPRRTKSASTFASRLRSSRRAAASCFSRFTTSWPTCRRRTSSPCSTPPTKERNAHFPRRVPLLRRSSAQEKGRTPHGFDEAVAHFSPPRPRLDKRNQER